MSSINWPKNAPKLFDVLKPSLLSRSEQKNLNKEEVKSFSAQLCEELDLEPKDVNPILKGIFLMRQRYPTLSFQDCFDRLHRACMKELALNDPSTQQESFLGLGGLFNVGADLLHEQALEGNLRSKLRKMRERIPEVISSGPQFKR